MYCSGLGKALLAAYSAEKVRQIVDVDGFLPITENTVRNFTQLKEELDNTRKRGYAVDNREANTDLICVAAPLRDQSGQAMAAISIATPYFKMDDDHIERFGELIVATALAISRKLGYLGEKMY
jgi:DNA-binding IclR family transcriptional regulator